MNDVPSNGPEPAATNPNWWLDPAIAKLAFGAGAKGSDGADAWGRDERLDLDLGDPEQRALGEFELLELIGEGGMGLVYRAKQTRLAREVAVKLLSAGPWASPEFVARFRQEAQHAAQLQHPGIVTVFEMGELDGLVYYAMQLVRGESLAQCLGRRGGRLPPREAAVLMRTVAEAVAYAHSLGVLHLDLKPANILLDEAGVPRVADFGLARRIDPDGILDNDHIAGTPSYMAPEQASVGEHPLTQASDVWGLGAILYELLCGRPPFEGSSAVATLQLLREGAMDPPSRFVAIAPDLEAICMKCLAKSPMARYPDARALADDFGRFLEGREVSVRPRNVVQRTVSWARREPWLATTAGFAILALTVGVVATSLQWRRAEHNATRAESNAAAASERLWESRREAALRLEQEGKGFDAIPRLLENIEEQQRTGRDDAVAMELRRIGLLSNQGATLIDHAVIADANPMTLALSPSGTTLAVGFNDQSVRWYDAATIVERGRVDLAGRSTSDGEARIPQLLRFVDERRLRVSQEWFSNQVSPTDNDTWLVDLDAAKAIEPPAAFADFVDASWSSNARFALLRNSRRQVQLWRTQPWEAVSPLSRLENTPVQLHALPWTVDPEGRFVANLSMRMHVLTLHAAHDLAQAVTIAVPSNAGISAWALSDDGNTMALGDFEGRVFMLDTQSHRVRQLPTMRGREITWLSFSEDTAWLVASNYDGTVYAYDAGTGDSLVSGPMRSDFAVQSVRVSRRHRLLIAEGEGRTALWRISVRGPRTTPAQRIGAGPAPHGLAGRYSTAWSSETNLLATSGIDGQLRLWRLPAAPLIEARAAPQIPEQTWFSGRSVVDVAWNQLRIVAVDGTTRLPWLVLPRPPGFAELFDDDRILAVTTGPELRIYDGATQRLRFEPLALTDSPQHMVGNADGSRLLLTFTESREDGVWERLELYDAQTGKRLQGEASVRGAQRRIVLSDDSSLIAAVGSADSGTVVLDAGNLERIGEYPHDPFEPVQWASFAPERDELLLVTRTADPRMGENKLLRWNPRTDEVLLEQTLGNVWPLGVAAVPASSVFVASTTDDALLSLSGQRRHLQRLARSEPSGVLALARDGRMLARGYRREVQLYDTSTWSPVGAPLEADIDGMDLIVQLAFSPNGDGLLARTAEGRWLLWRVAPDRRTPAGLAVEIARINMANESQRTVRAALPEERHAMRQRDRGPGAQAESRPLPAIAALTFDAQPVPTRVDGTSPELLDLGSWYDFGPDTSRNSFYNVLPRMRPFPAGLHRFGGIDFDVRGMFQMGLTRPRQQSMGETMPLSCLAVPAGPVAVIHPLLKLSLYVPVAMGQTMALMRLHYVDGGSVEIPLRAGFELPGFSGNDAAVPQVFGQKINSIFGEQGHEMLSAPRLRNPNPHRPVRCLDLEAAGLGGAMLLFAITVEPPLGKGVPPRPVIASSVSRSITQPKPGP